LAATAQGGAALYTPEAVEQNYREVLQRAKLVLASGRGVILDATFVARRWREAAAELAEAAGARLVQLEASCPDGRVLRARLAARRGSPSVSDATDAPLDAVLVRYQPVAADEPGTHFVIDTSGDSAAAVRVAIRRLERAGVQPARARRAS